MPWAGAWAPQSRKRPFPRLLGHPVSLQGPTQSGWGTGPCGANSPSLVPSSGSRCPAGAWQRSRHDGLPARSLAYWKVSPRHGHPESSLLTGEASSGTTCPPAWKPFICQAHSQLRGPQALGGNLAMKQLLLCKMEPQGARIRPADPSSVLPAPGWAQP